MSGRSPFPGMDPWLEAHWGDVHQALITYTRDHLQTCLPPGLIARMQERVFLEYPEEAGREAYPDVQVIEHRGGVGGAANGGGDVAVAEPLRVRLMHEPKREGFIQILDVRSGSRVITVIEVLSLSNKHGGEGQRLYLAKQRELADGGVSLVEIDLLRAGTRVLNVRPRSLPEAYRTQYQVCVRRGHEPEMAEVYAVPLRQPLPTISVPLRQADADVPLNLQTILDRAYENGAYSITLDYAHEPDPPLSAEDRAWADQLLQKRTPGAGG